MARTRGDRVKPADLAIRRRTAKMETDPHAKERKNYVARNSEGTHILLTNDQHQQKHMAPFKKKIQRVGCLDIACCKSNLWNLIMWLAYVISMNPFNFYCYVTQQSYRQFCIRNTIWTALSYKFSFHHLRKWFCKLFFQGSHIHITLHYYTPTSRSLL